MEVWFHFSTASLIGSIHLLKQDEFPFTVPRKKNVSPRVKHIIRSETLGETLDETIGQTLRETIGETLGDTIGETLGETIDEILTVTSSETSSNFWTFETLGETLGKALGNSWLYFERDFKRNFS